MSQDTQTQALGNWKWPESQILKVLIGCFIAGIFSRFLFAAIRRENTVTDHANNFIVDLMAPYMWGAFMSQWPLVGIAAIVSGIVFCVCLTNASLRSRTSAKVSLLLLLILSLFTIWLEPFTSISGQATSWLMTFAKIPAKILDVGVSVLWVMAFVWAWRDIGREFSAEPNPEALRSKAAIAQPRRSRFADARPHHWAFLILLVVTVLFTWGWILFYGA